MARVSQVVCDRCGGNPAPNTLRVAKGAAVLTADLCDGCTDEITGGIEVRTQAKRGRKSAA